MPSNKSTKKKPSAKEKRAPEELGGGDGDGDGEEMKQLKEEEKLLQLLEQRLQFILLTSTKLWQSKETNKKE